MNKNKLTRSNNRIIAGVCAGLAEWLGWDISLVRMLYLILTIFSAGFPGILAYLLLWIIMPEDKGFPS
jgi:phage shock protein C